jgi:hypothetical protein
VTLAYDGYGRLISYGRTGETSLGHLYNGLDDRVATSRGSETRRFVTDPDGRILGEYGATASDVKAFANPFPHFNLKRPKPLLDRDDNQSWGRIVLRVSALCQINRIPAPALLSLALS